MRKVVTSVLIFFDKWLKTADQNKEVLLRNQKKNGKMWRNIENPADQNILKKNQTNGQKQRIRLNSGN